MKSRHFGSISSAPEVLSYTPLSFQHSHAESSETGGLSGSQISVTLNPKLFQLSDRDFRLKSSFLTPRLSLVTVALSQGEIKSVYSCVNRALFLSLHYRRSNQSILKEISPEYSLEGLMLKLKLQFFGCLMQRTDSLEKTLMLGKIEGGKEKGTTEDEMVGCHHQLKVHESEQAPGAGDGQGIPACHSPWDHKKLDPTERLK